MCKDHILLVLRMVLVGVMHAMQPEVVVKIAKD